MLSGQEDISKLPGGGGDLSRKDVFTFFADMLLAGIDTSSYSTGFLLYHLARNKECQVRFCSHKSHFCPEQIPIYIGKTPYGMPARC